MADTQKAAGRGSPPSVPRWVKLFVVTLIVLVLLLIILHAMGIGFGSHGTNSAVDFALIIEYAVQQQ